MSRSTKTFGYAYPETVDWGISAAQFQTNVQNAVIRLYSRNATPPAPLKGSGFLGGAFDGPGDEKPLGKSEHSHEKHHGHGLKGIKEDIAHGVGGLLSKLGLADKDNKYREWFANIRVKKYALNASFFVHVFIGDFNPEPFSWSFEPKLVGSHCVFVNNPDHTECSKCKDDETRQIQVTASIPLTTTLIDCIKDRELRSLNPEDVEPFLIKNLHWRITLVSLPPWQRKAGD
jgi:tyrosinase